MDTDTAVEFIFLILLLMLSAFFSSAETAFTTANKIRIRNRAEEGDARAEKVLKIWENPGKMLSAILIGNNIVNLSASSLATAISMRFFGSLGAGIATFILTILVLIFGEISPKTLATVHAEKLTLSYANVIYGLIYILTPVIFIINEMAMGFLKLFHLKSDQQAPSITEGELKTIVDVSHEGGVIESDEREIIYNLFHFSDSMAKEIMVPRIDMVSIDVDASYDDLMELYKENMLTRFPVYEDQNDNIIGFLNMKDILLCEHTGDFSIREIMRQPYYTHEHKKTAELLVEMRQKHINIAIVMDEYGAAAGMITLEDLLEEIVGEIRDEYDDDEEDVIQMLSDSEYIVDGITNLEFISEKLNLNLTSEDYDSIGGFVFGLADTVPSPGDTFSLDDGLFIRVESMENNRIDKLYLKLPKQEADNDTNQEETD